VLAERLAARPSEGLLFGLFARHGLLDAEVALLLVSLAARLDGRATLTGAELARAAGDGSAARLAALSLLVTGGPLLSAGLLLPEVLPADGARVQPTVYRLADHVLVKACEIFALRHPAPRRRPTGPLVNQAELLAELRHLSNLWRRRAARVFGLDPWSGAGLDAAESTAELLAEARTEASRLSARLEATPQDDALPLLHFARERHLDLEALVILATVLFQELIDGVGAVDAIDLVRLVSENEGELVHRRLLLRPLARKGLLRLEGAYAAKDMTADASLPEAVVEQMLGVKAAIGPDERIDFHHFLQALDSSDAFFDGLGGPGPGSS